ncbi:MAG: hypothetical protein ABIF04_01445 [Chloroflexota bacterium]
MDHRPFEDWLLENKVLTTEENRLLNLHLRTCPSCNALAEVDLALKSVQTAEPAAGFANRFQIRLVAHKKALRQRNFWGFLVLTVSVLSLLTWLSWPVIEDLILSPVNWLVSWISSMLLFWVDIQAMFHAGALLFKVVPGFFPTYIWTVVLFAAAGWSLLWILSFIKFTKNPQGV